MKHQLLLRTGYSKTAVTKECIKAFLWFAATVLCGIFLAASLKALDGKETRQEYMDKLENGKVYTSMEAYLADNPPRADTRTWLEKQDALTLAVFAAFAIVLAAAALIVMAVFLKKSENLSKVYTAVWEDHIQGLAISPRKMSLSSFNVLYDMVESVSVDDDGVLIIRTETGVYRCPVEHPHQVIRLVENRMKK